MKGFKTFAFGILIAISAALASPEVQQFVAANLPAVGGTVGTLIIILRAITSSPIFKGAASPANPDDSKADHDA